jgi:catechol 2,3-dioxygenase-like lactoylglutathione lyase family enzyme
MEITGIDHLYAETADWDASVEFWERLGFAFVERWGSEGHRAGRLQIEDAVVVLAEVTDREPSFNVYLAIDGEPDPGDGAHVVDQPHDTHWGTRLARVRDPEGRVYGLEKKP